MTLPPVEYVDHSVTWVWDGRTRRAVVTTTYRAAGAPRIRLRGLRRAVGWLSRLGMPSRTPGELPWGAERGPDIAGDGPAAPEGSEASAAEPDECGEEAA